MPARGCTRDTPADRLAPRQWVPAQVGKGMCPTLGTVGHPPTGRVAPRLRSRRRRGPGAWLYRGRLVDLCRVVVAEVHILLRRLGRQSSTGYGSDCESPGPDESPKIHGSHPSRLEFTRAHIPFQSRRLLTGAPFGASDRLRGKPYIERMWREISIPRSPDPCS